MKKLLLILVVGLFITVLMAPAPILAAEQKNNPGVFDSGGSAKNMANISLAFGKGVLIQKIAEHSSSEGLRHSRGISFGAGFSVLDTAFDCATAVKCTARSFLTDAIVAAFTGGARGYGISNIGGDAPWLWAGLVESGWEFADEFGINAVYEK